MKNIKLKIKMIILYILYNFSKLDLSIKEIKRFTTRNEMDELATNFWDKQKEKRLNISVVMRVKNGEKYILLSLTSIVNLVNEVIIIDNGSTDNTVSLIKSFEEQYKNKLNIIVKFDYSQYAKAGDGYIDDVKNNPEKSLSRYYTKCFSYGTSEYLMKMDAHYVLLPSAIKKLRDLMNKKPKYINFYIVDILGRNHGFESLIFKNDDNWSFIDDEKYEKLVINGKKESLKKSIIFKPSILHLKRIG